MSSSPYAPAAKLLNQIWTHRKGLKTVAYSRKGELTCTKATYAQCAHVLQNKPLLDRLFQTVDIALEAKNEGLLYVLLYELLLGPNKKIRGGGALKRQLMAHAQQFQQALDEIRNEEGYNIDNETFDNSASNKNKMTIPRYVRVNTLKTTTAKVIKSLKEQKGIQQIFLDPHVPDVLVLPPTSDVRGQLQDLVTRHEVVLQDKSSCFSALCLVHGFDHEQHETAYLDACAAPGNKTSHLAALVAKQQEASQQSGAPPKIHALDKSPDRFKLLKRRMGDLVGSDDSSTITLKCHNLDFFEVQASSSSSSDDTSHYFPNVRAIMLDPSCSGSGMANNHQEAARDPGYSNDRVKTLANFQFKALQHATSSESFPLVTRVVYSTCSLYLEENEKVVQRFLQSQQEDEDKDEHEAWRLVSPTCLSSWTRRGLPVEGLSTEETDAMIRVHPDHDASNGFFVACLEKRAHADASKKKRKSSNQAINIGVDVKSSNIPLYKNEFHDVAPSKDNEKKGVKQDDRPRKDSTQGLSKRKVEKDEEPPKKQNKRSKESSPNAAPVEDDTSNMELKHAKKRAKKQEWKRKQRERKEARLKAKEQTGSTKESVSAS
jgi:putative methyltransferase